MRVGTRIFPFIGVATLLCVVLLYSPSYRDTLRTLLVSTEGSRYPPPILDLDPGWNDLAPLPTHYAKLLPNGLPADFARPKLRTLGLKLDAFLRRPVLSREEALQENLLRCPKEIADPLVNQDQLRGQQSFWDGVERDEILKRRVEIVKEFRARVVQGHSVVGEDYGSGKRRGIVLTAGNKVGLNAINLHPDGLTVAMLLATVE